jgi:D-galactose 1-dehydrogenase
MEPIQTGIVGFGKIAREAHSPSIRANPAFELAATAGPHVGAPGVAHFSSIEEMLEHVPQMTAVAICTPPQVRYRAARLALEHGKHVLLEKPPCSSVPELEHLATLARSAGKTLYQTWHSQQASAVEPAASELRRRKVRRVQITWKENVREWHPGQGWLWEPGGFGVFDPGINALSILTRIITEPLFARSAQFYVPGNCATPIAAELALETASGVPIAATFDFRSLGKPVWSIEFATDEGPVRLLDGGTRLLLGAEPAPPPRARLGGEYAAIYRRFAELISRGASEVDTRPLACVADLFFVARHLTVEPFSG